MIERLDRAIQSATRFILSSRAADALWCDFRTEAGRSDEWVSGYVIHALAQAGVSERDLIPTIDGLIARQRKNGGWAYNGSIPADADSTGWVLMALSAGPRDKPSLVSRGIRFLKHHQDSSSGGFCTYSPKDGIERVIGAPQESTIEGWLHPQPCVTALVLTSLVVSGQASLGRLVQSGAGYLLRRRNESGKWLSYWWKGHAYSTYLSLRALWPACRLSQESAQDTIRRLLAEQRADGGWNDSGGDSSEVFATAFCMLSLLLFPEFGTLDSAAKAAAWLLEQQEAGGRWPAAPILRVPAPMAEKPDRMSAQAWRVMQRGTGVTVADQNAIYTSAAAMWALGVLRRTHAGNPA
jgi:squalene cyclase